MIRIPLPLGSALGHWSSICDTRVMPGGAAQRLAFIGSGLRCNTDEEAGDPPMVRVPAVIRVIMIIIMPPKLT